MVVRETAVILKSDWIMDRETKRTKAISSYDLKCYWLM